MACCWFTVSNTWKKGKVYMSVVETVNNHGKKALFSKACDFCNSIYYIELSNFSTKKCYYYYYY